MSSDQTNLEYYIHTEIINDLDAKLEMQLKVFFFYNVIFNDSINPFCNLK